MKKNFLISIFLISLLLPILSEEENTSDENIDMYSISVGFNLKTLNINDAMYFDFYTNDVKATILEIVPIDEKTCKLTIAVPWNRAGSFQNYVIYLKTGDMLQTRTGSQIAVGLVGDFKYNELSFVGITK